MSKKISLYPDYISKHNSNHEHQIILLIILNRDRWHYLAVRNIWIIKRNNVKIWWWFLLFELSSFVCGVVIPSKHTKTLYFNQYQKSDKTPFIIYADLESLIRRTDGCKNTLRKKWSFQLRISSVNSFLRIWSHFLKRSLIENFIFCVVIILKNNLQQNLVNILLTGIQCVRYGRLVV